MLVVLPASIAFGVTVYSAIGPTYAAYGAIAGIVGATVIGLVAATLRGTDRLISAPCAPAAAVLAAFAIELSVRRRLVGDRAADDHARGHRRSSSRSCSGFVGIGRLIRYISYPVVAAISAVGLIIIGSQIPASSVPRLTLQMVWTSSFRHRHGTGAPSR